MKLFSKFQYNIKLSGVDPTFDNSTWTGVQTIITNAQNSLNSIQSQSANFNTLANQPLGSNSYTNTQSALTTISQKYDSAANTAYLVTNPSNGNSGFMIELRNGFVSYTASSSFSYPIYMQLYIFQNVIYNSMSGLVKSAGTATSSSTISGANSALSTVNNFVTQLQSFQYTIYNSPNQGDTYVPYIQLGFTIYYAVCIGCVALMVLGTFAFACCGCLKCRCLSHLGWVVLAFLMIIGFLIATVMFPLSVVLIEACGVIPLDQLATNRKLIPDDVWGQIGVCLTGNGDIYTQYKLGDQLNFATSANDAINLVTQIYSPTTDSLIMNISTSYVNNVIFYTIS